ncbi:MAG: hypothetical protein PQJ60_09480 [Spirochaetales bacterium]|nr:hypothetical protein [Spirochaetales bacterium]
MTYKTIPGTIYFVSPELDLWPELEGGKWLDPQTITSNRLTSVDSCWIIMTYLYLKERGQDVRLSDKLVPGEICMVDAGFFFRERNYNTDSYIVVARGDCSRSPVANYSVVQNRFVKRSRKDIFIPHWPQPGLVKRDRARKNRIERITFKGSEFDGRFKSEEFLSQLKELGVEFKLDQRDDKGHYNWGDYSDCDLVLAVRDHFAIMKPASKLVNSWRAGVPALLGKEPAYRELRESEYDYIEVTSARDIIEAIRTLKNDPDRYERMVENGLKRAEAYTFDAVSNLWIEAFAGPIYKDYSRWKRRSESFRILGNYHRIIKQQLIWKKEKGGTALLSFLKKSGLIKSKGILNRISIFFFR